MRRRPFLHSLAAGAVLGTGCLGATDSPSDSALAGQTTDDATARTNRTAVSDDATDFAVESVETFDYVVRLNDLGSDPGGGVAAFEDLGERERRVVEAAVSGGYETDDPPEWLTTFAGGTPFVRRDGTYYRLDHALPVTTITAEAVAEGDVSGRIASYGKYEAAVTHDGRVTSGLLRIAREQGFDLTHVWPSLREFLDDYDAVRYHGEIVAFSVSVADSGPPYTVAAERVAVSEAVGGSVWDVSEADARTRELVRAAGNASGAYGFGRAPDGFLDALEANRYVYLDDTFYTTYVETRNSLPVSVSAEFADASHDGGGELRLAVKNESDREMELSSGAPRPFGVLRYRAKADDDGATELLWTDAYEESEYVETDGRAVTAILDIGLLTTLSPGEKASRTFEIDANDLPSGEYVVENSFGVDFEGGDTVRYRVVFSVA